MRCSPPSRSAEHPGAPARGPPLVGAGVLDRPAFPVIQRSGPPGTSTPTAEDAALCARRERSPDRSADRTSTKNGGRFVKRPYGGRRARDGGPMRVSGPTGTSRIAGADQRPARGSFPQRGDCGLALPVAEEARAQFPQRSKKRSKKRRNSEARTVFRAPQGGQVASADLTRGRRRMRESDGQEPDL